MLHEPVSQQNTQPPIGTTGTVIPSPPPPPQSLTSPRITATVGYTTSNAEAKNPSFKNIELSELKAKLFEPQNVKKGAGGYFIRSALIDTQGGRKQSNMIQNTTVLLIDGDTKMKMITDENGKAVEYKDENGEFVVLRDNPPPSEIHALLDKQNIPHIIYTSGSHGLKGNRYRVVIFTEVYTKEQLKPFVAHVLSAVLNGAIEHVNENLSYSQPWYFPTVSKAKFEYYESLNYVPMVVPITSKSFVDATPIKPTTRKKKVLLDGKISPIDNFNQNHDMGDILEDHGYEEKSTDRYLHPNSTTGEAGTTVTRTDDGVFVSSFSDSDLLSGATRDCYGAEMILSGLSADDMLNRALEELVGGVTGAETVRQHNDRVYYSRPAELRELIGKMEFFLDSSKPVVIEGGKDSGEPLSAFLNEDNICNAFQSSIALDDSNKFSVLINNIVDTHNEVRLFGKGQIITELFGNFLDTAMLCKKYERAEIQGLHAGLIGMLKKALITQRNCHQINTRVELDIDKSTIEVKSGIATVTLKHEPFSFSRNGYQNVNTKERALIETYKTHFPFLDNFISLIVASRLATDRKQAYFYINAPSSWGKDFLMSAFEQVSAGFVARLDMKDLKKMQSGEPVGRTANQFTHSWIALFNEVRYLPSELKQAENYLSFSPKNKSQVTVPVYAKVLMSAESIPDLQDSDSQLSNRVSLIPTNDDSIEELNHHGQSFANFKGELHSALVKYIRHSIDMHFVFKDWGLGSVYPYHPTNLTTFNEQHSIKHSGGSIEEAMLEQVVRMKELIRAVMVGAVDSGLGSDVRPFVAQVDYQHEQYLLITSPNKVINMYLKAVLDESEIRKFNRDTTPYFKLIDESPRDANQLREGINVVISDMRITKKGLLIKP